MSKILTDDGYVNRIRDKMGVDDAYLPDSAINQPDIIDVAEISIISLIPNYDELIGDARVILEALTVIECCILLCPSMAARLPEKSAGPHASYELGVNWEKKREEFLDDRDKLLGDLSVLVEIDLGIIGIKGFGITYPKREW